jgi:hypothetical protein
MLQEADSGLTDLAMQGAQGRYAADNNLVVKFYMHPRMNRLRSEEEGRPIFEEMPYIQILTPGNKDSIIQRPASEMDKRRFAEHYRKFEARITEEAVEGTLLEEWPGVTRSQVEELRYFNIRTVEQLVNISDGNAQNIMGFQMLKAKAEKFLEMSAKEAELERQEELLARLEALEARNVELEAAFEEVEEVEED